MELIVAIAMLCGTPVTNSNNYIGSSKQYSDKDVLSCQKWYSDCVVRKAKNEGRIFKIGGSEIINSERLFSCIKEKK